MDNTLLTLLTIFVGITAIAFVAQAVAIIGMGMVVRRLATRVEAVTDMVQTHVVPLVGDVRGLVADSRVHLDMAGRNLVEITAAARNQVLKADAVLTGFSDGLRLQAIRFDELVSGILEKLDGVTEAVQRAVLTPVRDVSAIVNGIRTGVEFFFRHRPSPVAVPRSDDEMFI
ncbi:MAG: hypothetical protein ACYC6M_09215 [Terriglobales bacterium]